MSTVWLRVSRGDCLTPAPPGQQGPPKLLVRRVATRYSAQEAPAVSADITWAAAAGLPAESKVRGGGGLNEPRYCSACATGPLLRAAAQAGPSV